MIRDILLRIFLGKYDFWFGLILLFICSSFVLAFYFLYRLGLSMVPAKAEKPEEKAKKVAA